MLFTDAFTPRPDEGEAPAATPRGRGTVGGLLAQPPQPRGRGGMRGPAPGLPLATATVTPNLRPGGGRSGTFVAPQDPQARADFGG